MSTGDESFFVGLVFCLSLGRAGLAGEAVSAMADLCAMLEMTVGKVVKFCKM